METLRTWTDWVETAEYIVREIKGKYKYLQQWLAKDITMSFSPVFLILDLGPWRYVSLPGLIVHFLIEY